MNTLADRRSVLLGVGASLSVAALSALIADPADAAGPAHWTGRVASFDHSVNLRSGPGFNYRVVAQQGGNTLVSGYIYGSWLKTSRGYLHMDLLLAYQRTPASWNGRMSNSMLSSISTSLNSSWSGAPGYTPRTVRYLRPGANAQLRAMNTAFAKHFGHNMSIDLAYRSLGEQQYWSNRLGYPAAAHPGTSNHGFGLAVDFWENNASPYRFGQSGYEWLRAYGPSFGWTQPSFLQQHGVNPEYWHFNFVG